MSQVQMLYTLQQIDDVIRSGKQRLSDILARLNEPAQLATARQAAAGAADRLAQLQRQQRDLELQLGTLNAKHAASHERLYSGKVRSARELTDLQLEVDSLKQRRAQMEEQLLEAMLAIEEASAERNAAAGTLAELEAAWQAEAADLEAQKQQVAIDLTRQLETRKEHVTRIDAALLRDYLEIGRKKRGVAVCALNGNECSGCRTSVSLAISKQVQQGQIAYCGACGRILVQA